MSENEIFDLEKYNYKCLTNIKSDNMVFFKKAKITMNGKQCIVSDNTLTEKQVSLVFGSVPTETIMSVAFNVTEPKAGEKAVFNATTDNENISINGIMWNDSREPISFEAGKDYTVSIFILPKNNAKFPKYGEELITSTINGKKAEATIGSYNSTIGKVGTYFIEYTFSIPANGGGTKGDVNNDGKIDVTDITKISAHIKGKKLLS